MQRRIATTVELGLCVVALIVVMPYGRAAAQVESTTQMQLVASPPFLARVEYLALQQARTVKAEPLATACHAARTRYADALLAANNQALVPRLAAIVVGGVNLIGTVTGTAPTATSSATDPAILSQIATFWNAASGCDTGS